MSPYLAGAGAALLTSALILVFRTRVTPEERERRRRLRVHSVGRLCDAVITEVRAERLPSGAVAQLLQYTYDVRGVGYAATQDITGVLAWLDRDPARLAGPVSVKYVPENPSNSIVICEQWSGLRPLNRR